MEKYLYPTEAVTIDLGDGKERELRYSLATLRRLRTKFGTAILGGELFRSTDDMDRLPDILWEGLIDKSEIKDADQMAELIHPAAAPWLIMQFYAALNGSFPTPDPNDPSSQPTT